MSSARPLLADLADLIHGIRYEALPPEAIAHARRLMLDTIGCALGAVSSPACAAVRAMAAALGGAPQASLWGAAGKTSTALATLVNGTALRYLDSNDYLFARDPAHPSANLAVALAVGEPLHISGRRLIEALAGAYEVHLRLAEAAGAPALWKRGWHHGTNAQFSAAALAACLMQPDPDVTAHAMAIAGSHHNTLAQLQSGEISMIKASAEAWVTKGGVEAAVLAAQGMTGPLTLIEGRHGWADTVAGAVDADLLRAHTDGRFRIGEVCIKPYPAVATAMAPIQAALDLAADIGGDSAAIEQITVRLPSYALGTPSASPERRHPQRRESADHSFYYCVAIALLDGACGEAQFDESNLQRPLLQPLLDRITLVADASLDALWPGSAGGGVDLRLRDGRQLSRTYRHPPGHPRQPLDAAQIAHKFHESADPVLSRERALRVRRTIETIDQYDDIGVLCAALRTDPPPYPGG
jgi:2-methylcitrate dehydratase